MADSRRLFAHKEWAPGRKSDPVYAMTWRRQRVAALMAGATKPPHQEDDMPLNDADKRAIRAIVKDEVAAAVSAANAARTAATAVPDRVWSHRVKHANGRKVTAESQLSRAELFSWRAWSRGEVALTALAEIGTAVASIAPAAANVVGQRIESALNALLAQGDAPTPDQTPDAGDDTPQEQQ